MEKSPYGTLSFSYIRDIKIQTERFGEVKVDLAYGGIFYAIVSARDIELEIVPREARRIIEYGETIRKAIQEQVKIEHPTKPGVKKVLYVQFTASATHPKADMKNVVVVSPVDLDRSPCSTGTSARMADLYAKGKLHLGDEFVHESIIGTLFRGEIVGESRVGDYPAINTEISGRAYITSFQQFVAEPDGPFKNDFLLAQ